MRSSLQTLSLAQATESSRGFAAELALALAASAFVALCAHVSLPLLFTPVPLTLGNFAVLLVGLFLGPRTGLLALLFYLAEGAIGFPVFNPGGAGGLAQLLGPTGGYLLAYPAAAAVAGVIGNRTGRSRHTFAAGLAGSLAATGLVLASGLLWLAHTMHLSLPAAATVGLVPFIPGELVKALVAAGMLQTLSPRPKTPHF